MCEGGHSEENQRAAYLYGTYVGQAFQLIDDALDFEGTAEILLFRQIVHSIARYVKQYILFVTSYASFS